MVQKLKNKEVTIKVRGCVDRRKQRNWLSKEYTTLPTVYTKGIMRSCMIVAMEGQYAATSDIPGSFLHTAYYKREIHLNMEREMVTIL